MLHNHLYVRGSCTLNYQGSVGSAQGGAYCVAEVNEYDLPCLKYVSHFYLYSEAAYLSPYGRLFFQIIVSLCLLTVGTSLACAQSVFVSNAPYKSNITIYVTEDTYEADLYVCWEKYPYQAKGDTGRWHTVAYAYQADQNIYYTDQASRSGLVISIISHP